MSEIKWQEPPPAKAGPTAPVWPAIFAELRKHPGRWALVRKGIASRSLAVEIQRGKRGGAKAGEFEAVMRANPEGGNDIYARFVGKAGEQA